MAPTEEEFRASTYSAGIGQCVEIGSRDEILIRDSKDPAGPWISVTRTAWRKFLGQVKGD